MLRDYNLTHTVKGPTWLKPVHCMLKLTSKLASKARVKQLINVPPVLYVQCVNGTQGEPGNEAMSVRYLNF